MIVPVFSRVTLDTVPDELSAYIPADDLVLTLIIPPKFSILTGSLALEDCPNIPIKPVKLDPAVPKSIVPVFWTVAFTLPNIPTELSPNILILDSFIALLSSSFANIATDFSLFIVILFLLVTLDLSWENIPTAFLLIPSIVELFSATVPIPSANTPTAWLLFAPVSIVIFAPEIFLNLEPAFANTPVAFLLVTFILAEEPVLLPVALISNIPIAFSPDKLIFFLLSSSNLSVASVFSAIIATELSVVLVALTFIVPSLVKFITLSAGLAFLANIPTDLFAVLARVISPLLVPFIARFALFNSKYIPAEVLSFTVISAPVSFKASAFLAYIAAEDSFSIVSFPVVVVLTNLDSSPYIAAEDFSFIVILPLFVAGLFVLAYIPTEESLFATIVPSVSFNILDLLAPNIAVENSLSNSILPLFVTSVSSTEIPTKPSVDDVIVALVFIFPRFCTIDLSEAIIPADFLAFTIISAGVVPTISLTILAFSPIIAADASLFIFILPLFVIVPLGTVPSNCPFIIMAADSLESIVITPVVSLVTFKDLVASASIVEKIPTEDFAVANPIVILLAFSIVWLAIASLSNLA